MDFDGAVPDEIGEIKIGLEGLLEFVAVKRRFAFDHRDDLRPMFCHVLRGHQVAIEFLGGFEVALNQDHLFAANTEFGHQFKRDQSTHAVPDEAVAVQVTAIGIIDPLSDIRYCFGFFRDLMGVFDDEVLRIIQN